MTKQLLAVSVAVISVLSACQTNYEKAKSGLKYKIFKGDVKNAAAVTPTSFVKFHVEYRFQGTDSVFLTSYDKMPTYTPIDTTERTAYTFMEILPKTKVGDSIVVVMSVDSLKNKGLIPNYDNIFKRGDNIIGRIKVLAVYQDQQAMMTDLQNESNKAKENEIAQLQQYISKNKINAQRTPGGCFLEIKEQGTGAKADSGKLVSVYYTGYLLSNMTRIDSNMDTTAGKQQPPYQLVIGAMQAIPGFDEALRYLNEGGKARVYIPSSMGYGPQGSPPVVPPSASLIFDLHLTDVAEAPKQPNGAQQLPR